MPARLGVHLFRPVDTPEIVVRIMVGIVSTRLKGALEPGQGLVVLALLDEVGADIVVRVAELRIDPDSLLAERDGLFELALKMVGPAQVSVRFRGGMNLERPLVRGLWSRRNG